MRNRLESARVRLKEVRSDRLFGSQVGTALSADWMRPERYADGIVERRVRQADEGSHGTKQSTKGRWIDELRLPWPDLALWSPSPDICWVGRPPSGSPARFLWLDADHATIVRLLIAPSP
jgi:hypothetical protein